MERIETVRSAWDELRDGQFFRIVSHVFPARVLEAASSLLAANDEDVLPAQVEPAARS